MQTDPAWSVRACIDWLERADLFIVTKTDHRKWYAYHSLVRDFLKERLRVKYGDEVVTDLNRKSAKWFIQQGLLREAIRHALESGDLDLTASLIEDALCGILNSEDRTMLDHYLSMLPAELIQRRPFPPDDESLVFAVLLAAWQNTGDFI